jgi:sucrose-6F-phosphate phosphohydrolase
VSDKILLCTDLDRTLLPNGEPPESPGARELFTRVAQRPDVDVAYVTGRHKALVQEAIEEFQLPTPDYVLGDVGSTIYEIKSGQWSLWQDWQDEIGPSWAGYTHDKLAMLFNDMDQLKEQEEEKQNTFKLSYYVPEKADTDALLQEMQQRLQQRGIRASLIWSIDDLEHIGLLDLLPENATKLHAIEFLIKQKGYAHDNTLFAGDSGNDLPVMASGVNSVLVANARDDVRQQAKQQAAQNNNGTRLYLAQGNFLGMNGNYSAGILEGLVHFIPSTKSWFDITAD